MKIEGIEHVFFDLDHTLWDFDRNSALTFDKIFKQNQLDLDIKTFLLHYEPINLNYWKLYRDEKIDKQNLRYKRLKDTFDAAGYLVDDVTIDRLSEEYITNLSTFSHLFEGAFEILDYLKASYQLHIITNGFEEAQQHKMNSSNIASYFRTVTNCESAGVKKPHPQIFEHALRSADAIPNESLMIGDNYEADILGAKDAGFNVILFDYHKAEIDSDITKIDHLLQLKQYL